MRNLEKELKKINEKLNKSPRKDNAFKQQLKDALEKRVTDGDEKKKEWFRKHVIIV